MKLEKAFGTQACESTQIAVKSESVFAVKKNKPKKSGKAILKMKRVSFCLATNHLGRFCKLIGHVEKCYKRKEVSTNTQDDATIEESEQFEKFPK